MHPKTLTAAVSCAILFFGLALYLVPSALPGIAPVRAATRTITLAASYQGYPYWNNSSPAPTITVTKGDTVNIMLSSDGSQHQLLVDFDGDGPSTNGCATADKCSSVFMSSTSISFVANSAGNFHYYCTLHPSYMVGMFDVQSPADADFGVTSSPSSLTVAQGSSGTATVTMTGLNGFSGRVNLTSTVSPSGPIASLNPSSVSLTSGTSAPATLTISTTSGYYSTPVAQGNYAVNVTASSGSLSHSTTVMVTVASTNSQPSSNSSLPVLPIVGGIIGAIVVAAVAVFLLRRKR